MRNKKMILIIDDDDRNIFALSAILRAKGFNTISAGNMTVAFELLENHLNIDVILIDMMMPEMDGYQAIPKIKAVEKYESIPVVAVTAQAMTGDREKCLASGADDYISKPVDIDLLLKLLNGYIK